MQSGAALADSGRDEHLVEGLATALLALPTEEILDFEEQLAEAKHQAYRWEVWGAAYLINGGCSDDGFQDFRAWLVAQGRDTFRRAVADPDSLAEHPAVRRMADSRRDGWLGLESLHFAAEETYERRTGDHETFSAALTERSGLRVTDAAQHPPGESQPAIAARPASTGTSTTWRRCAIGCPAWPASSTTADGTSSRTGPSSTQ